MVIGDIQLIFHESCRQLQLAVIVRKFSSTEKPSGTEVFQFLKKKIFIINVLFLSFSETMAIYLSAGSSITLNATING